MSKNNSKNESFTLHKESVVEFVSANHEITEEVSLSDIEWIHETLNTKFAQHDDRNAQLDWFEEGVPCQFIRSTHIAKNWIDGKLRLTLAFFPDRDLLENPIFNQLNDDDWIEASDDDVLLLDLVELELNTDHPFHLGRNIFSNKELIRNLREYLSLDDIDSYRYAWFDYGIPCKVLLVGTALDGWKNGRIHLKIEIKPDVEDVDSEVQSSLDEIRNAIEAN